MFAAAEQRDSPLSLELPRAQQEFLSVVESCETRIRGRNYSLGKLGQRFHLFLQGAIGVERSSVYKNHSSERSL